MEKSSVNNILNDNFLPEIFLVRKSAHHKPVHGIQQKFRTQISVKNQYQQ